MHDVLFRKGKMHYARTVFHDELAGARGTELPPPLFQLSVYIFIFNKIALLFHLFFLNLIP